MEVPKKYRQEFLVIGMDALEHVSSTGSYPYASTAATARTIIDDISWEIVFSNGDKLLFRRYVEVT